MPDQKLAIIGAGNLAWNLAAALKDSPFEVVQVFSRHLDSAFKMAREFPGMQAAFAPSQMRQDLDAVIVASSDHGIEEIAAAYAPFKAASTVVAHTSGSIPLDALSPFGSNIGVLYALQTFTKGHAADFSVVPIFLEGNAHVLGRLSPIAGFLSRRVSVIDSAQRLQLHLGAVFAANFANYMWLLSEDILKGLGQSGLEVYAPLIRECMDKALRYGPANAQTGPARRGDAVTMDRHLQVLQGRNPGLAAIYQQLSRMIADRFREQG
jgi:predicted short-subunit dehydrogenase-like oxidoreductase (DUF2520 family)